MFAYITVLAVIIGAEAWAMSWIVPWWGCVTFGVLGLLWSWAMFGGPEY